LDWSELPIIREYSDFEQVQWDEYNKDYYACLDPDTKKETKYYSSLYKHFHQDYLLAPLFKKYLIFMVITYLFLFLQTTYMMSEVYNFASTMSLALMFLTSVFMILHFLIFFFLVYLAFTNCDNLDKALVLLPKPCEKVLTLIFPKYIPIEKSDGEIYPKKEDCRFINLGNKKYIIQFKMNDMFAFGFGSSFILLNTFYYISLFDITIIFIWNLFYIWNLFEINQISKIGEGATKNFQNF
jgi:hypothetical protein